MSGREIRRTLVPVGDSVTLRNTVAYVVREAAEAAEDGEQPVIHFVYPAGWRSRNLDTDPSEEAEALLDRVRAWVREDLGVDDLEEGESLPISVTAEVIALDEYLFSPRDYAEVLLSYAEEHELDHIVLDPEYQPDARAPLLSPLEAELDLTEWLTYEEAPVERGVRGRQLLRATAGTKAFLAVFGLSFLFYQVLGGFAGTFDYVTGAVSAALVAAVLSGITFTRDVRPVSALVTGARLVVYIPYLFWEIAKANVQIVYIILHPSLPIDPSMERFRPAVPVGLPVTSLANSITLTPGTVTVEARKGEFYVHALTESARESLYDGGLERAIRFVFFGRGAARFPSPRERGQTAESEHKEGDGADEASGTSEEEKEKETQARAPDTQPGEDETA